MITTKIALIRDHSGSMSSLRNGAINDFNLTLAGIKNSTSGQKALISVVECGVGYNSQVIIKEKNIDINNKSYEITKSIVYFAKNAKIPCVAEFVHNESVLHFCTEIKDLFSLLSKMFCKSTCE